MMFQKPPVCAASDISACVTAGDGQRFGKYVRALQLYASEAWARCGKAPAEEVQDAATP